MRPALFALLLAGPAVAADRPNVLFVTFDDLRPQLGCYGDKVVKSPCLDRFAASATRFDRAYCQCAICSPSRSSFLSGLRPATTGLYGFGVSLRDKVPDVVTLPQHFKNNSYHAAAVGKLFHVYAETILGSEDDPQSWSVPLYLPKKPVWGPDQEKLREQRVAAARAAGKEFKHPHDWPRAGSWDAPDVPDDSLQDGEIAAKAIEFLDAKTEKPFFLAVGFLKPHLPYVAPKRYWDLYDRAALPLPASRTPPSGAPKWAIQPGPDRLFANVPAGPIDEAFQRSYLHGYLASISYADAQFGRLIDALDRTGLRKNTVVVVLGDHGYQMGEYGSWGTKNTVFETSTRIPLLVSAPGAKGGATGGLVELVDLYASLADLCGLPPPARHEGTSFRPLLANPAMSWKRAAFSDIRKGERLGRSVRTAGWRYIEWTQDGKVVAEELYNHAADPGENENVAAAPANAGTVADLRGVLKAGWRSVAPR